MMNGVLSQSGNNIQLGLIGNPENRRISMFRDAAVKMGYKEPVCVSWENLLDDFSKLDCLSSMADIVRIDSPGENERVSAKLIQNGGNINNAGLAYGQIGFLREYQQGFNQLLHKMSQTSIVFMNSPADIRIMFDKWKCHQRFVLSNLPRPAAQLAPLSANDFRDQMRQQANGRVFLKPLHGSSASGVCALRWSDCRMQMFAPVRIKHEDGETNLYNSLRVYTYTSTMDIDTILSNLLPQGMICEQWIPKASIEGGTVDLRILVINKQARHWVVRQSNSPMTNLHLGNNRSDPELFHRTFGDGTLQECFTLAENAAACFPDSLYAGVDILADTKGNPYIGEINAFGDLLPGLCHCGESCYEAILNSCMTF